MEVVYIDAILNTLDALLFDVDHIGTSRGEKARTHRFWVKSVPSFGVQHSPVRRF